MFFIFDKVKDMAKMFQDDIGFVLYMDGKQLIYMSLWDGKKNLKIYNRNKKN